MEDKCINVVYICDEKYVFNTIISLRSLYKNRNNKYYYNVHVITKDLKKQSIQLLQSITDNEMFNVSICSGVIESEEVFGEHLYVSKAALLKFKIPRILGHLDRAIYVDGDIIFRKGFETISHINIDQVYAAVVKDMPMYTDTMSHMQELKLDDYFNSGVMYMNLQQMRNDNIEQKLIDYKLKEEKHLYMDQDALNVIMNKHVIFIHPKYNFFYDLCERFTKKQIALFYGILESEVNELSTNACVFHLTGEKKPWKDCGFKQMDEWVSYIQNFKEYYEWEKEIFCNREIIKELSEANLEISKLKEHVNQLEESIRYISGEYQKVRNISEEFQILSQRFGAIENWIFLRVYKYLKRKIFGKRD